MATIYVGNLMLNPELKSRDFDVISRDDGKNSLLIWDGPFIFILGTPNPIRPEDKRRMVSGL